MLTEEEKAMLITLKAQEKLDEEEEKKNKGKKQPTPEELEAASVAENTLGKAMYDKLETRFKQALGVASLDEAKLLIEAAKLAKNKDDSKEKKDTKPEDETKKDIDIKLTPEYLKMAAENEKFKSTIAANDTKQRSSIIGDKLGLLYLAAGGNKDRKIQDQAVKLLAMDGFELNDKDQLGTKTGIDVNKQVLAWMAENPHYKEPAGKGEGQPGDVKKNDDDKPGVFDEANQSYTDKLEQFLN